jgi:large subunit ribosomal protein L25
MSNFALKVESRGDIGSNKVKKLRANNIIPAVVYCRGQETKEIGVNALEFHKVYKQAGLSSVIDLKLDGETLPVVIKEIQRHPFKGYIAHIDFQKVSMSEKIKMTIPIVLINRDNIRLQPSVLVQQMDQIEIECLPQHLPKSADVDVADMDFSSPIYVRDLNVAKMEDITILNGLDEVVCSLTSPVKDEEVGETDEALSTI